MHQKLINFICFTFILSCLSAIPGFLKAQSLAEKLGYPQSSWDKLLKRYEGKEELDFQKDLVKWKGSHYEIGKQEASYYLKHRVPLYQDFIYDIVDGKKTLQDVLNTLPKPIPAKDAKEFYHLLRQWFPEQAEEIRGFSDGLGIPVLDVIQVLGSLVAFPGCTVIGVGKSFTHNNNVMVGRNYDLHPAFDDQVVAFTQPAEGFAVLGDVAAIFGRYDGVNEKGLFISMSVSLDAPKGRAFFFGFVIRHALENAANTEEAVKLLSAVPHRDSYNYTVVDRNNRMAVVETRGDKIKVRYPAAGEDYIVSANHYEHADMLKDNLNFLPNSIIRNRNAKSFLRNNKTKITLESLDSWLKTPYEKDGAHMNHYQSFFFGTVYSYVADLQTLTLNYRIGEDRPPHPILMSDLMKKSLVTIDSTGLIKRFSAKLHNRFPSLTDYVDLDWWATPENEGFKGFSSIGGSVNPIGLMLENRFAYRIPLASSIWGPYLDLGASQTITPVFHRHGLYVRWSSKSWLDAELGYERHVGFRGIEAGKEGDKYEKINVNDRLEKNKTVFFDANLSRLTLQMHGSVGPIIIINYFDRFLWEKSEQINAFYNFETGLSQEFAGETRNNLMLLAPLGAPDWAAGLFYQRNWLDDKDEYGQFTGIQVNLIKFKSHSDAIFRVGGHNHHENQINAPEGVNLQVLVKMQWF